MGKVTAIPEGRHTAAPYLCVREAGRAIAFYQEAFGASEVMRIAMPDGRIGHAEITIGDSLIMLADEFPEHNRSPQTLGGTTVMIHLYVADVDAFASRAVGAGATLAIPASDQFYGDRSGRLIDPFGHVWVVATHIEDVTVDEMRRRMAAMGGSEH
jgi:PhnB protein